MTYEELKNEFLSVPQKGSFSYKANSQTIHLVKFPVTDKVEYLYMAKPSLNREERLSCMRIGSELWFVGMIVKHDTFIVHDHLSLLRLSNKPETEKLETCQIESTEALKKCALELVDGKELPAFDDVLEKKAENFAMFSLLHDEAPDPDLSGLVLSCNSSELLVAYLSDMTEWVKETAKNWLAGHEQECLTNIAIAKRAVNLLFQWGNDPNSVAHRYKGMRDATKMVGGRVMVKYSDDNNGDATCYVNPVVFLNQYGDDYGIIPVTSSFARAKGHIRRDSIYMILDGSGEKILWKVPQTV